MIRLYSKNETVLDSVLGFRLSGIIINTWILSLLLYEDAIDTLGDDYILIPQDFGMILENHENLGKNHTKRYKKSSYLLL